MLLCLPGDQKQHLTLEPHVIAQPAYSIGSGLHSGGRRREKFREVKGSFRNPGLLLSSQED